MTNISEGQRFKRSKIARIDKFIFNKKRKGTGFKRTAFLVMPNTVCASEQF